MAGFEGRSTSYWSAAASGDFAARTPAGTARRCAARSAASPRPTLSGVRRKGGTTSELVVHAAYLEVRGAAAAGGREARIISAEGKQLDRVAGARGRKGVRIARRRKRS